MGSPFEASDKATWTVFENAAFDQSHVFREGPMSEAQAKQLVEDNPQDCIGFSFHSGYPEYRWVVRKGTLKLPEKPGWTVMIFKVQLPKAGEVHLFRDDFAGTEEALGSVDPGNGWARPGRGEGLGDTRQDLEMIESVSPNDLRQGGLGDCWLISSFAALAEFPQALKHIVHPKSLAMDGKYTVDLLDYTTNTVVPVVVDDRLPKGKYDDPAFTGFTADDEIWPCILEKAVAKLAGSYARINGGDPLFALGLLTGCRDLIEFHQTKSREWICVKPEYRSSDPHGEANRMLHGMWPDGTGGNLGREWTEVLKLMAEYDSKDYLMCCGSHAGSDTDTSKLGIVQGHAYTVLTVARDVAGSGRDLLQLRNPWGSGEWHGDWSDQSDLWRICPEIKEALDYEPGKDGIFWIEAPDFFQNYSSVMVCCKDMGKNRAKARRKQLHPRTAEGGSGKAAGEAGKSAADLTTELLAQAEKLREAMEKIRSSWLQVKDTVHILRQECSSLVGVSAESAERRQAVAA